MSETNNPIDDFVSYYAPYLAEAPTDATEPPETDDVWRVEKHLDFSGPQKGHYLVCFGVYDDCNPRCLTARLSFHHWSPIYGEDYYRAMAITDADDMMRQLRALTDARGLRPEAAESARPLLDYVQQFQGRVSLLR